MKSPIGLLSLLAVLGLVTCALAQADNAGAAAASTSDKPVQETGEVGSPSATTTIPGKQLPAPDPQFGGVSKGKAAESKSSSLERLIDYS